jgi:hypothetical protein
LVIADAHSVLENWRFDHFQSYDDAGIAANSADPDSDGLENLMEFAMGLDPNSPSLLPANLEMQNDHLEYTYTRSKAALGSVSFRVEWSDSLENGTWTGDGVAEISPPLAENETSQTVKVLLPTGLARRFCRLKVTLLP